MKKTIIVLSCFLLLLSCKQENTQTETLKGNFIFLDDAAVLHGEDFIYGVEIDKKAKELAEQVEPIKQERFDMIPVEVEAIIKDNPNKDGWEKIIEVKEILNVSPSRNPSKIKMN